MTSESVRAELVFRPNAVLALR